MNELMLINPRKRRRKRKMSALQAKYFGKRRKRRGRPASHRLAPVYANPRKRRRKSYARRYRRNPALRLGKFNVQSFLKNDLMPAGIGAAGALGLDMLIGTLSRQPTMARFLRGPMRPVLRIAGAVGVGMLAGMMTNRRMASQIGAGALTVVMYDTLKGLMARTMPALPFGENDYQPLEYISPAPMVGDEVGAYITDDEGIDSVGDFYNESAVGEYVESEY